MSLGNPGDFNGDGRVNYVDQQIFNQFINPSSGQYNPDPFGFNSTHVPVKQQSDPEISHIVIIGLVIMGIAFVVLLPFASVLSAEFAAILAMGAGIIYMFIGYKNLNKERAELEAKKKEEAQREVARLQALANSKELQLLKKYEGQVFRTSDNTPFLYSVTGSSIELKKRGTTFTTIPAESIIQALSMKNESELSFSRFPAPTYVYAIIHDPRIEGNTDSP